jgi:hypothetical protein
MILKFRIFLIFILLIVTNFIFAETITIRKGVTFELPTGLISQPNQSPPATASWVNKENSVAVSIMLMNKSQNEMSSAGLELENWPGTGLSTVKGFGNSLSKSLEKTLNAPCSFTGQAEERDLNNVSFWVTIDTTCQTTESFNLRSRLIIIYLNDSMALIRIDANPPTDKFGERVAATIWHSIQVDPTIRLETVATGDDGKSNKAELSGGKGFFIIDYRTIKPTYLVGSYVGAIIGSIFLGMLFTLILLKLKLKPLLSLIISQLLCIALSIYGAEEDGAWELDPILYIVTSSIAVFALWKWAKKKSKL